MSAVAATYAILVNRTGVDWMSALQTVGGFAAILILYAIIQALGTPFRVDRTRQERIEGLTTERERLRTHLQQEQEKHVGPEIYLAWGLPEPRNTFKSLGVPSGLVVESRDTLRSFNIEVMPLDTLDSRIKFEPIHQLEGGGSVLVDVTFTDANGKRDIRFSHFLGDPDICAAGARLGYYTDDAKDPFPWKLPMEIRYSDGSGCRFYFKGRIKVDYLHHSGVVEPLGRGRIRP